MSDEAPGRIVPLGPLALAALLSIGAMATVHAGELDGDCDNAVDTPTITACAAENLEEADEKLNAVYKRALAYQADIDKMAADAGNNDADAVKSLKTAERAWITYRDAHCEAVGAANIGGTAYATFVLDCQTELTRNRAKELNAMMDGGN